jgi:diguanylate cyclase (GGDEF)-like protein
MVAKDFAVKGLSMSIVTIAPTLQLSSARKAREFVAQYDQGRDGAVTLFLVGIRDLKHINERYGRETGDVVIRKTGARLLTYFRESLATVPVLARLPGREFLIAVAGEHSATELEAAARRLVSLLSDELGGMSAPLHISPRVGIAIAGEAESGADLLQRAHEALAQAYSRKGRKYSFAGPAIRGGSQQAALLDKGLRSAIASGEIIILLQPQFEVASGRLSGAEALARWHHPEIGEVGAGRLFASADRCDLREELSALIQQEAVSIASRWTGGLADLRLAVNLGAEELGEGYADRMAAILRDSGFSAKRLTLELTEESLVRDIDLAAAELNKLRAQGIRIAVDDFGTGYSSLSYLSALPLDYLKLDKGMTPAITGASRDRVVLRAIIAMAKALELKIIAEGVEREEELEMLRLEGCDYFQGFLRSKPLSPSDFERFALLNG